MPGMKIDPAAVETNIVLLVRPAGDAARLVADLKAEGVLATRMAPTQVRLVTHLDVDDAGIDRAITALARVSRALSPA
jgi:threonine aldolase